MRLVGNKQHSSTTSFISKANLSLHCFSLKLVILAGFAATVLCNFADETKPALKLSDSDEQSPDAAFTSNLNPSLTRPGAGGSGHSSRRGAKPSSTNNNNATEMLIHEREFVSPQVRVQMECQRDKTIIKVNFTQPFSGTLGSGRLDSTKCKLNGNGTKYYELQVQHNATQCDTQWDSNYSSIINTLFIRFHPSLETGSDIAKNIMCRLTVGDLIVGRRPLKTSPDKMNSPSSESSSSPELSSSSSSSSSSDKSQSQLTDKVSSNSVSTINEKTI